jgi:hypothetical protein
MRNIEWCAAALTLTSAEHEWETWSGGAPVHRRVDGDKRRTVR